MGDDYSPTERLNRAVKENARQSQSAEDARRMEINPASRTRDSNDFDPIIDRLQVSLKRSKRSMPRRARR